MPDSSPMRHFEGNGIELRERAHRACIDLRGDARDSRFVRAVESATDLRLPLVPGRSSSGLLASILWLGPDQWLAMSDTQGAEALVVSLAAALRGIVAAVTDVSHARIVYAVSGPNARHVLAKGCPLDLHERAFAVGGCAQTLLAKVSILVQHSAAEPVFDIHVARSVRDYAWVWLQTAAAEFAPAAGGG